VKYIFIHPQTVLLVVQTFIYRSITNLDNHSLNISIALINKSFKDEESGQKSQLCLCFHKAKQNLTLNALFGNPREIGCALKSGE
jgi:hypothetical protein